MPLRFVLSFALLTTFISASLNGAAKPKARAKVVCFGDSITKRGYPKILGQLLGVETINAGVGGNSSGQALRRVSKDVLAHKPDVVVIFFGTNDLRVDAKRVYAPVALYSDNLASIIDRCRAQGIRVVLCTLPPIGHAAFFTRHNRDVFDAMGGLAKMSEDYRTAALKFAAEQKTAVVDLNQLLDREPQWMSKDGVHPSEEGNAIIAKHIAKAVAPLIAKRLAPSTSNEAEIVVIGATSAGIAAAVQAARMNKSVLLLEPHNHVGGLTTGGLGATDIGNKDVIGGISREFYQRVARHYQQDSSWTRETREEFFALRSKRTKQEEITGENGSMWTFEPSVAQKIFGDMMREVGVEVRRQQKLKRVIKNGSRITQIETEAGQIYRAKMFIDATYEGDLLAKAGVKYRVGREANSEFNETLNGIRAKTPKNQIYGSVDPYVVPGDPSSGLIPLIQEGDGGVPGEGDHRVQAYNFRLCFTDVPANRLPLTPPKNYDPGRYELAVRRAEKIVVSDVEPKITHFCNPVWMPNRKTDINNSQGISTDFIGGNYEYPDAAYEARARIWQAHEDYVRGFWYFMSTSPRIPESLRKQFQNFGPCRDEFQATGGWPSQLYVREARRMVSAYVMTEHNCRSRLVAEDSVGMAAYGMDSHNCQRIVKNGIARNEGDVQVHGLRPYPIAYRSIIPVADECENLVVPVCVSATHIAFGSIRMEPVFMVLGQSSAIVASLAIDAEVPVQDIQYQHLRPVLLAAGQILKRPTQAGAKPGGRKGTSTWTNGAGDNNWHNPKNWVQGERPRDRDGVFIDRAGESRTRITKTLKSNPGSIYVGSEGGQIGELEITGGAIHVTSIASRKTRAGLRGGEGVIRQSGGSVTLNALQVALDAQSVGTYHLSGGQLVLTRLVDRTIGSLDIGAANAEGHGTFTISGGSLTTHSGVTLGRNDGAATFSVEGSTPTEITFGGGTLAGFWKQNTGSTLRVRIDEKGITPIRVSAYGGQVTFAKNSLLDVGFSGTPRAGSWDVMKWKGELTDHGLKLSPEVDRRNWSFAFVDTDNSGSADTLRVTARAAPKAAALQPRGTPPRDLNFLFLVSDDLRPDLGCYGNTVIKSPNIDALARRALVFNRAYCQQAVCSPSRTSVMTGMRPDTTKVWDLRTHFRKALPDVVTLPQLFKEAGYTTRGLGKIYHGSLDDAPSWSTKTEANSPDWKPARKRKSKSRTKPFITDGVKLTRTDRGAAFAATDDPPNGGGEGALADEAIATLRHFKKTSEPFFLAVGFHKPHLPFSVPKFYWDLYDSAKIPLATNPFLPKDAPAYSLVEKAEVWNYSYVPDVPHFPEAYARKMKHGYYAAVSYMDAQLGRVLDELDTLGMRDNTVVILWGDHGWKLGEHDRWAKHSNVEQDTRSPLLISAPGMKAAGKNTDALVEFVDIYPTLAELAGLPLPKDLEGTSVSPLLDDPERRWKTAAFSQYPRTVNRKKKLMGYTMRTDRYRFTRWVAREDHSKLDAVELYDHHTDPEENVNIANHPAQAELIARLTRQSFAGWKDALPRRVN